MTVAVWMVAACAAAAPAQAADPLTFNHKKDVRLLPLVFLTYTSRVGPAISAVLQAYNAIGGFSTLQPCLRLSKCASKLAVTVVHAACSQSNCQVNYNCLSFCYVQWSWIPGFPHTPCNCKSKGTEGKYCYLYDKCSYGPGMCKAGICVGQNPKICPKCPVECQVNKCNPLTGKCEQTNAESEFWCPAMCSANEHRQPYSVCLTPSWQACAIQSKVASWAFVTMMACYRLRLFFTA